jgi:hypothetical protein
MPITAMKAMVSPRLPMDTATSMDTPAPTTAHGNSRLCGTRLWTVDRPTTPTASPMPSAVNSSPKPAGPAWSTWLA